ncbi:DUF3224 domain-containing protein [Alteromonas facilis]|uniref:DUF3224 domain-containing protein n=1 Tax=Alteromonas facilis TaxID=2048004 RepID=UPI001F0BA616|nr:DUF3224 domain-containing protein [Alteromonas facilis]
MLRKLRQCVAAMLLIGLFGFANISDAQEMHQENNVKEASGSFTVQIEPQADSTHLVGRLTIDKQYSGDMVGTGEGQMLSHRTTVDGSAGYVAIENVTATLEGKTGSFVLQHSGQMSAGEQNLLISIIPDSGSDGLVGIQGEMTINIVDGQHFYALHYSL